jgi:hypothetical protein
MGLLEPPDFPPPGGGHKQGGRLPDDTFRHGHPRIQPDIEGYWTDIFGNESGLSARIAAARELGERALWGFRLPRDDLSIMMQKVRELAWRLAEGKDEAADGSLPVCLVLNDENISAYGKTCLTALGDNYLVNGDAVAWVYDDAIFIGRHEAAD